MTNGTMTLEELKQQIAQDIDAATTDVGAKQSALRQAELRLSFLQGQLHALNQIHIEEKPIYSEGADGEQPPDAPGGPFLHG